MAINGWRMWIASPFLFVAIGLICIGSLIAGKRLMAQWEDEMLRIEEKPTEQLEC